MLTKIVLTVIGLIIVLLVAAIDRITPSSVSLVAVYLVPICVTVWMASRRMGIALSLVAAWAMFVVEVWVPDKPVALTTAAIWNFVSNLALFLLVTLLLAAYRSRGIGELAAAEADTLTGIANKSAFLGLAATELHRARRSRRPCTLAYLDIDNFKVVNETQGQPAGDTVLQNLVKTMRGAIRAADIMGRLGGDEFAVLLPETDPEQAQVAVGKIEKSFSVMVGRRQWPLTLSGGVVTYFSAPTSVEEMVAKADGLMRRAKEEGKSQIRYEIVN